MDKHTALPETLKTRAMALLSDNRLAEARAVCTQWLELAPHDVDCHVVLSRLLRRSGNPAGAEGIARRALELRPDHAPALLELGAALQQQGQAAAAISHYQSAILRDAGLVEAHYLLANALRETGQPEAAAESYRKVLQLEPDHFAGLNNLGILLLNLDNGKAAIEHLEHAQRLQPGNVLTLTNLGEACTEVSRYEDALRYLRMALSLQPDSAIAQRALANALHHAGHLGEALDAYDRLATLQPASADAIIGKARIHERLGNYEASNRLLEPLLAAGNRDAIPVFFDISKHPGQREKAAQLLETLLHQARLRSDSIASIHFQLGKYYDEIAEYEHAFEHYSQANSLTPANFDRRKLEQFVSDSIMTYTPDFVSRMPTARTRSRLPVFIVGMPRSGTSLVEQILASHPDVHGAGELQHLSRLVQQLATEFPGVPSPLFLRNLTQPQLDQAARQHLGALAGIGGSASRVTDKMPGNVRYVGLIRQLFPEAAVIHCARHPLDTCLSCYFANFGNVGHGYIYDLRTVGEYYLQYHRLMQHWESVFPDKILQVSYASLVQDQEAETRRLVEFCGLPWNDRCLAFHETDRTVFTLSYDQVRQPMYTRSLERWRHYERQLQPLRALLEAGGIDCS